MRCWRWPVRGPAVVRPFPWAWAAAAAIAVGWSIESSGWAWPSTGRFSGNHSAQLSIGRRAVAVTDGQTALTWSVAWTGETHVKQQSGGAFYRVADGAPFVVSTDLGTVRVRGTCFGVEVESMNTLQGLITGAATATAMTIAVYEGRVDILNGDEVTTLTAGERARVSSTGTVSRAENPAVAAAKVSSALVPIDEAPPVGAARRAWTGVPEAVMEDDEVSPMAVKVLRSKNARLQRQIKALTAEVMELRDKDSRDSTVDPDPVALQRMARECELAWDMPSINIGRPPEMSERQIRRAEVSEAEADVVNRVFAAFNDRVVEQTRALYVEVTGDDQVSSQSVQSMFAEINDKVAEHEKQFVFSKAVGGAGRLGVTA